MLGLPLLLLLLVKRTSMLLQELQDCPLSFPFALQLRLQVLQGQEGDGVEERRRRRGHDGGDRKSTTKEGLDCAASWLVISIKEAAHLQYNCCTILSQCS